MGRREPYGFDAPRLQCTPTVELDEETIDRLDSLRVEDESYDAIVSEVISISEAEELTLFHSG